MNMKKQVVSHLKGDIKTFKKEASEDRKMIKKLKKSKKKHVKKAAPKKKIVKKAGKKANLAAKKVKRVMKEFKEGKLHSGSLKGPRVKKYKQGVAIALSEADQALKKK